MSEDLDVDHDRQAPTDDPDATAVRPALADDLLEPPPFSDDEDGLDEELLASSGRRPSLLTRVLLGLLICAVGVFVGVQVARVAAGPATASAGAAGARRAGAAGTAAPRTGLGSPTPAAAGEVTAVKAHTLVLADHGAGRTVTFTGTTTVTEPYAHGKLGIGDVVTVFGSRAADGSVNATSIVVR
jgi:hypothetical protein